MNHLLAKTKGRGGKFYKVISDKEIFAHPDNLDNPVAYNAGYKLEDEEWFAISNFTETNFCLEILKRQFASTDFDQITRENCKDIEYLCSYQSGNYYFQKVGSKQFIQKKLISINTFTLTENEPVVVINEGADAVFDKEQNTLFFKSLPVISSIFKGIDSLYREATQEETESFLQKDFIRVENNYDATKVKVSNRKRIAMVMDTLNRYTPAQRKSVFKYISQYCDGLNYDTVAGNFTIKCEDDLKKLLFGIEERYYTTKHGKEKRLANSVIKL